MSEIDTVSHDPQRHEQRGKVVEITVFNEDFEGRRISLHHTVVTGKVIAEAYGQSCAGTVIILRQSGDGVVTEIHPEEEVPLGNATDDRFFVVVSDRTYRFVLDGQRIEWPLGNVSASLLLRLARKPDDYDVWQECGPSARLIEEDEVVSLTGTDTERFVTRRAPKTVTVYYNENPVQIDRGKYKTEQLLTFFHVEAGYILDLIRHDGEFVELKPGDVVQIREGQKFISHAPCGQSS